jgi:ubiquinone/menaquinone biosynthesis C-methylase UbiE
MPDPLKRSRPVKPRKAKPPVRSREALKPPEPEANAKSDGYIPFRDRFRAWWDGAEPGALVRKGQKPKLSSAGRAIELDRKPSLPAEEFHGAARVRVCDNVWGQGFVAPGGATYAVEMARPFSTRSEASVLDLSAGLGGRVGEIAKDSAVKIVAMERDQEFSENASERAKLGTLSNLPAIQHLNPERLNLNGLKYDCVMARELFFTIPDKLALLGTLRNGLRKNGALAFTDFVLAEPDQNEGSVMDQWHKTEPVPPQPWSIGEYRGRLESLNLRIVEFEDDTEFYRKMVLQAWQDYADGLEQVLFDEGLVDALMREAELWLHRVRALESGQLKVLRVHARLRAGH